MSAAAPRIVLGIGETVVGIDIDIDDAASYVAVAFASLATEHPPTVRASISLREGRHVLVIDDTEVHSSADPTIVIDHLVSWCNREAVLTRRAAVNLHAAGLVEPESQRLVLVPGAPGAGKTTTAGTALQAGWGFLSDELISVVDARAQGYPKPLTVKDGPLRASLVRTDRWTVSSTQRRWYVPAADLGGHVLHSGRPHAVMVTDHEPGAASSRVDLTAAETLLELATNCQDELDEAGVTLLALAGVAATTVGARVVQGAPGDALPHLRALAATDVPSRPEPVARVTAEATGTAGPVAGPGTVGVDCGDGAVLHDPRSGALLLLDRTGALVWWLLDGATPLADLSRDLADAFDQPVASVGPQVDELVARLRAEGFVAD